VVSCGVGAVDAEEVRVIAERLIEEYLVTVFGAGEAYMRDPLFHTQVKWARAMVGRLEVSLLVQGVDVWRAERVMRDVVWGSMEDPVDALTRVEKHALAVRLAAVRSPAKTVFGDV
jgi:hypothetical protein